MSYEVVHAFLKVIGLKVNVELTYYAVTVECVNYLTTRNPSHFVSVCLSVYM